MNNEKQNLSYKIKYKQKLRFKLQKIKVQKQMGTIDQIQNRLYLRQIFNEQQSSQLFQQAISKSPLFNEVFFHNVGIKIMRQALKIFQQNQLEHIEIKYNWNDIMVKPQLVCYDKNTWKTLQQLASWNREWSQLFNNLYSLRTVHLDLSISWMDSNFIKSFLEGLTRLPNIQEVILSVKSKDQSVKKMLEAFQQAQIFPSFKYKFEKL